MRFHLFHLLNPIKSQQIKKMENNSEKDYVFILNAENAIAHQQVLDLLERGLLFAET